MNMGMHLSFTDTLIGFGIKRGSYMGRYGQNPSIQNNAYSSGTKTIEGSFKVSRDEGEIINGILLI